MLANSGYESFGLLRRRSSSHAALSGSAADGRSLTVVATEDVAVGAGVGAGVGSSMTSGV